MSKEAMKLALEALELVTWTNNPPVNAAITTLQEALAEQPAQQDIPDLIAGTLGVSRGTAYDMMREALAQPEQEPVAWMNDMGTHIDLNVSGRGNPLYIVPPQRTWVGISDKDAQWLYDNCRTPSNLIDMTEAKVKELNT